MQLEIIIIMHNKKPKVIYYKDELKDDFLNTKTNIDVTIDKDYEYLIRNPIRKVISFLLYYGFAIPLLFVFGHVFKNIKVVGKRKIRKLKKTGYIMYANHTNVLDAFLGHVYLANPKRTYIIANKDAVSIFLVRRLTKDFGTLPVPDTKEGLKNLNDSIKEILENNKALMIYPEAHIWPYYTGIRPFPITSFKYAVTNNVPVVPIAVTYQEPVGLFKSHKKPRMVVYIGDPITPDKNKTVKDSAVELRDYTFNYIKKVVEKYSTNKLYDYVKEEQE